MILHIEFSFWNLERWRRFLRTFFNSKDIFVWYHHDGRFEKLTRKQIQYTDWKRDWWKKK